MYKDNSRFADETDEEVQLVFEVGYIASRVRFLDRIFHSCCDSESVIPPNGASTIQPDSGGGQSSLGTINPTSNSTSNVGSNSSTSATILDNKPRHILEDLLIRIYEEHQRFKDNQSRRRAFFRMSSTRSEEQPQHKNENNVDTTTTTTSSTISTTPASNQLQQLSDDSKKQLSLSNSSVSGYVGDCVECIGLNRIGDISEKKNGRAVVLGSSVIGLSSEFGCSSAVIRFNSSTATTSTTDVTTATTTTAGSYSNVPSLVTIGANSLSQFAAAFKLCDDDLRVIVRDLRRKVEYSEKMNWLCIAKRPITPPHRKSSLPEHTEVKKRFLEICDRTLSDEVKAALRLPAFDSYDWEDAAVIHLMQTMFMELGLIEKFNIPIGTLREWLYEVYKHYNEVPFHNFRHCFCVAQMMYAIARQANLISRLGELEVLILLVSCICHDLDHPGYNNIYQINARTELALRYNDISPLENHHCSIAFRLLEHPECNIFKNFNRESFNFIREGIIRCILATDMARHNEILTQFKDVVPVFDYSNRAHINLLCMVLIKVADISNEARPMDVAEPWLDRLLQEFFAQSAAEKSEGLPVTPFMDPDKVSKPGSQVRFIGIVLLPLFEALGDLLPDLTDLIIIPVRVALDYYKRLNDAQTKTRKSLVENTENSSDGGGSPSLPRSQSGISVRSRRSIPSQKSASRTSVDEPTCLAAELQDLPEGSESGDSETATEVDVAEKTSKFKVDTEGSNRSKSSHSTSRKSSREKRPSMISEMCSSGGRMRNSYGNIHGYHSNRCHFGSNRAVSLDQYSSNNRRLSDGLQQVISDSNVFYNRHNMSLENEVQGGGLNSVVPITTEKPKILEGAVVAIVDNDALNMNMTNAFFDNASINRQGSTIPLNNKNGSNSSSGNGNCSQNGTKTWKARFKQITELFTFGFERNNKRFTTSSARSSPCSIRNNNANASDLQKPGICCTISNNMSPNVLKRNPDLIAAAAGRNRAYSLDVPSRNRYSSSSGGGDSRKSSRNDENSCNRHDPFAEDNNSNHTSSGAGEMPTLPLPPHIRIGVSDSSEPIGGCISDSRPKI